MFSIDDKFEYFLKIEKQVIIIIKSNYKHDPDKIVKKINDLFEIQNRKCSLKLKYLYDKKNLTIDIVLCENRKDIFKSTISIRQIIREIRLDIILGDKY